MIGKFMIADWRNLLAWIRDGVLPPHLLAQGKTPSVAAGANAGTGATASILRGTDTSLVVKLTTGTGPTAGQQARITLAAAYVSASIDPIAGWLGSVPSIPMGCTVIDSSTIDLTSQALTPSTAHQIAVHLIGH